MADSNNSIENLIYLFSKLPGLGTRSARRIVLYLLKDKNIRMNLLSDALKKASEMSVECKICSNISDNFECNICNDETRNKKQIAVVETVADLWAIERSGNFLGNYHVLGSSLSAIDNNTPKEFKLDVLRDRIKKEQVEEIIIATNSTLDGQTTAFYLTEYFNDLEVKISRLASGIPIGGELDYLDEGTLSAALNLRQPFK